MPPKQPAFKGHPIQCPTCHETIMVSCVKCKGASWSSVEIHRPAAVRVKAVNGPNTIIDMNPGMETRSQANSAAKGNGRNGKMHK